MATGFKNGNPGCPCCGGSTVTISGCPCASIATTLYLTSSEPASNNGIFQNATLVYGATPPDLILVVIVGYSFLSTTSFPDAIMGDPFYYFLTCVFGTYILTRVYPVSPFGSPFRDTIRYSWIPGFPGNNCSPFDMTNGQIFRGGDATCVVTVHA